MVTRQVWNIGTLLQWTADFFSRRDIGEPRLSAELLLAHALGCTRLQLYTQFEREPPENELTAFRALVKQRGDHAPVAYLIGKAWFYSLEFNVAPAVLIPRPDTETLVEQVIGRAKQTPGWEAPRILDLCTGSGCVAIALAKHLPNAMLVATDNSEAALAVARENATRLGASAQITFQQGDLFAALDATLPMLFHVIAGNPPYIPTKDIATLDADVRDHEPRSALDGGLDGLDYFRRIIETCGDYLVPGGMLILETGFNQTPGVQALMAARAGLCNISAVRDAAGHTRCAIAFKTQ